MKNEALRDSNNIQYDYNLKLTSAFITPFKSKSNTVFIKDLSKNKSV